MRRLPIVVAGILLAAAPVHAEPQTTLVFFSEWSAQIDDDAGKAVQHAADQAKAGSSHKVTVTGYTDTTGSEAANKLLAQLRAQMVTDQLVTDGVAAGDIVQKSDAEVPAPADSKQLSRRVGITID